MARTRKKDIDRELHKIFEDADGKLPDLRKIEISREHRIRKILIALVIFFAALSLTSWAGFLVFGRQFRGEKVGLDIETPSKIVAGEAVDLLIRYNNRDRSAIAAAKLNVKLPKEFTFLSSEPEAVESNKWEIGSIAPYGHGQIKISGKFLGKVGSNLLIEAVLIYKPANFNSEFEKVISESVVIEDFVLDGSILGPDKILAGEEAIYKIKITNKSDNPQIGVVARLGIPASFSLVNPPKELGPDNVLKIDSILSGEEKEFELKGSFSVGAARKEDVRLEIGFLNKDGELQVGREVLFSSDVLGGELELGMVVNSLSEGIFSNFGDTVSVLINYKNKGESELKDVELSLFLAGFPEEAGKTPIKLASIKDDRGGKRDGGVITWTKKQIQGLVKLGPGSDGQINLTFELVDNPFTTSSRDYRVELVLAGKISFIGDVKADRVLKTEPLVINILSDTELGASGRYYTQEGIVLGMGPLPPKVGETTNYRIFWELGNTLHEIENIEISTVLPAGVNFTGRTNVGAGDLRYDEPTRRIIWTLNRMPLSIAHLETSFEVSIAPNEADRGKIITFVNPSSLTARDKFNLGIITFTTTESITTALDGDDFAQGKGVVQ